MAGDHDSTQDESVTAAADRNLSALLATPLVAREDGPFAQGEIVLSDHDEIEKPKAGKKQRREAKSEARRTAKRQSAKKNNNRPQSEPLKDTKADSSEEDANEKRDPIAKADSGSEPPSKTRPTSKLNPGLDPKPVSKPKPKPRLDAKPDAGTFVADVDLDEVEVVEPVGHNLGGAGEPPEEDDTADGSAAADNEPVEVLHFVPLEDRADGLFSFMSRATWLLRNRRSLLTELFKREFVASFKSSYLGLVWHVLAPFISMLSWLLLRYSGILVGLGDRGEYVRYLLVGVTLWTATRAALVATRMTLRRGHLMLQVRFPHEALLMTQIATMAVRSGISIGLAVLFVCATDPPPILDLALFVVAVVPLVALSAAIGILLAPIVVVFPDIDQVIDLSWGFLFVATPIIYRVEAANEGLQEALRWNPFAYLLGYPRDLLLADSTTSLTGYSVSVGLTAALTIVALRIFAVGSPAVVERLL